jgi:hypothetical protein
MTFDSHIKKPLPFVNVLGIIESGVASYSSDYD